MSFPLYMTRPINWWKTWFGHWDTYILYASNAFGVVLVGYFGYKKTFQQCDTHVHGSHLQWKDGSNAEASKFNHSMTDDDIRKTRATYEWWVWGTEFWRSLYQVFEFPGIATVPLMVSPRESNYNTKWCDRTAPDRLTTWKVPDIAVKPSNLQIMNRMKWAEDHPDQYRRLLAVEEAAAADDDTNKESNFAEAVKRVARQTDILEAQLKIMTNKDSLSPYASKFLKDLKETGGADFEKTLHNIHADNEALLSAKLTQ